MDFTVKQEPMDIANVPEPDYRRSSNSAINNSSECLNPPPIVVQVDRVQVDSDIEMDSHSTNAINCIKDECPSNPSTSNSELESEDEDHNETFEPLDEPSNSRFVSDMRLMKCQLKCPFCAAPPLHRQYLDSHILSHFNCRIYVCPDCPNKQYVHKTSLFYHRKAVHQDFGRKSIQMMWNRNCPFCDAQSFASKAQFVRHLVLKHRSLSQTVIKNSRYKAWTRHSKSSSNTGRSTISFCPHPRKTPCESIINGSGGTEFECSICKLRSFATISEQSLHIISHFNIDPYKCPYCPLRGSHLQQLYKHRSRSHPHITVNACNNQKPDQVVGGKCEFCPYSFVNPNVLSKHVLGKHAALLSDSQREYYQSHLNPNTTEGKDRKQPSYIHCPSCDIRFPTLSHLADHLIEDHGGNQSIDTLQSPLWPSKPTAVRSFTTSLQSQTPSPNLPAAGKSKSAEVRRCRDCAAEFESLELFMTHKNMSRWSHKLRIGSKKAVHKMLTECSVHKLVCRETQLSIDLELVDIKPSIDNPICDLSKKYELPAKINEQLSTVKFASLQIYGDTGVINERILIECPMCSGRYSLTQIYNHFSFDQFKPTNHHEELPAEESILPPTQKMEGLENEMLIPKSEDSVDPSLSAITQTKCDVTIKVEAE